MEVKRAPQLIFQISLITEVHQFGVIDEHDEGRRSNTDLGTVENIQTVSGLACRRRVHADAVDDHFIESA